MAQNQALRYTALFSEVYLENISHIEFIDCSKIRVTLFDSPRSALHLHRAMDLTLFCIR